MKMKKLFLEFTTYCEAMIKSERFTRKLMVYRKLLGYHEFQQLPWNPIQRKRKRIFSRRCFLNSQRILPESFAINPEQRLASRSRTDWRKRDGNKSWYSDAELCLRKPQKTILNQLCNCLLLHSSVILSKLIPVIVEDSEKEIISSNICLRLEISGQNDLIWEQMSDHISNSSRANC